MPAVADDTIPISKVLSHCVVSVERYRGLVKSDECLLYDIVKKEV